MDIHMHMLQLFVNTVLQNEELKERQYIVDVLPFLFVLNHFIKFVTMTGFTRWLHARIERAKSTSANFMIDSFWHTKT